MQKIIKISSFFLLIVFLANACTSWDAPNKVKIDPNKDPVFHKNIEAEYVPDSFSENGRLYYFSKIFGTLKYVPKSYKEVDYDNLFLSYYDSIKQAASKEAFSELLIKFVSLSIPSSSEEKDFIKDSSSLLFLKDSTYFTKENSLFLLDKLSAQTAYKSHYVSVSDVGMLSFNQKGKQWKSESFPDENLRALGMADYWNVIHYFYVHKRLLKTNWDSVLYTYIPVFSEANTEKKYITAICKITALLEDAHVGIADMRAVINSGTLGKYYPNFSIQRIEGKFIIDQVMRNGSLEKGKGDVLLSLNGVPLDTLYKRSSPLFSFGNQNVKNRILCSRILFSDQKENILQIKRGDKLLTVKQDFLFWKDFREQSRSIEKSIPKKKDVVLMYGDVAYMNLNDLYSSNISRSIKTISKYKKIIIDFRAYPNDNKTTYVLWNTLLPPLEFFYTVYPDLRKPGTFRKKLSYSVGRDNLLKDKQAIVLVSAQTQSAAEHMVMALQQHPNVKTIGTPTAGANGNVAFYTFPGNIPIVFTGMGILYPDGTDMQQSGVRIDKIIEPSMDDMNKERDYLIDEALRILK